MRVSYTPLTRVQFPRSLLRIYNQICEKNNGVLKQGTCESSSKDSQIFEKHTINSQLPNLCELAEQRNKARIPLAML